MARISHCNRIKARGVIELKKRTSVFGCFVSATLLLAVAGCGTNSGGSQSQSQGNTTSQSSGTKAISSKTTQSVSQVMNWYAQPEQGGQWDAQQENLYQKAGLQMTTKQGGPQVSTIPLVAAGKYTFGMASADSILLARAQGIPIVAIFAPLQEDPQVLIWHSSAAIKSFADMNGHPVYVSAASPYWAYIKSKYKLNDAKQMTYTGSLVNFVHSNDAVIQGYVTQEPYVLKQEHVPVKYELVADSGFNPYQNVMFTTEQEIKAHPDVVKAFVKASQEGWQDFLQSPSATDNEIHKLNSDLSINEMDYSVKTEKPLVTGGDAKQHGIGYMSEANWTKLEKQMKQTGLLKSDVNVNSAFTDQFLPQQ
jgi:NitT/TauT family transport system substrate-binding protein